MHLAIYHERAGHRDAGGIAVYVRQLALALAGDHEVTLLTGPGALPRRLRRSSVAVVQVRPWPTDSAAAGRVRSALAGGLPFGPQPVDKLRQFAGCVRTGALRRVGRDADVVWTHQFLDDLLVSRTVDAPTGYQYHGVRSVGAGALARERFTGSDLHLANSEPTAREVGRKLGREVDGVVRPGVDLERFHPSADPAFERGEPTVLFVGRVTETKGAFDLLEGVARLDADGREAVPHCYFVGRGETGRLRERARSLGVTGRVTTVGAVSHDDLPGFYAAADVACVPAHYESFGMANLEAMACGTPVVATEGCRAGAIREAAVIVPPGDPGALADELRALLDSPERRARLGETGRAVASRHGWSGRAAKLASLSGTLVG